MLQDLEIKLSKMTPATWVSLNASLYCDTLIEKEKIDILQKILKVPLKFIGPAVIWSPYEVLEYYTRLLRDKYDGIMIEGMVIENKPMLAFIKTTNIDLDFIGPQLTDQTHPHLFIQEPSPKKGRRMVYLRDGELYAGSKKLDTPINELGDVVVMTRDEKPILAKNVGFIKLKEGPGLVADPGIIFRIDDSEYIIKRDMSIRLKLNNIEISEALYYLK
ncbi:MAG: hypothetical protein INQ03_12775 [Candidatus Heimdallarchaeota archaeon]|nr:hypothetical protein [Candidatus Heimdallarchaeota archaeon]